MSLRHPVAGPRSLISQVPGPLVLVTRNSCLQYLFVFFFNFRWRAAKPGLKGSSTLRSCTEKTWNGWLQYLARYDVISQDMMSYHISREMMSQLPCTGAKYWTLKEGMISREMNFSRDKNDMISREMNFSQEMKWSREKWCDLARNDGIVAVFWGQVPWGHRLQYLVPKTWNSCLARKSNHNKYNKYESIFHFHYQGSRPQVRVSNAFSPLPLFCISPQKKLPTNCNLDALWGGYGQ